MKKTPSLYLLFVWPPLKTILNMCWLTLKIMKYCHDCLTPIKTDSKEEYCAFCKRDRALKENSVAWLYFSNCYAAIIALYVSYPETQALIGINFVPTTTFIPTTIRTFFGRFAFFAFYGKTITISTFYHCINLSSL